MRKRKREGASAGTQLRDAAYHPYRTALSFTPLGTPELRLYRAMREAIPVLDAAIVKLVRLTGGFDVRCADPLAEQRLREFLAEVVGVCVMIATAKPEAKRVNNVRSLLILEGFDPVTGCANIHPAEEFR